MRKRKCWAIEKGRFGFVKRVGTPTKRGPPPTTQLPSGLGVLQNKKKKKKNEVTPSERTFQAHKERFKKRRGVSKGEKGCCSKRGASIGRRGRRDTGEIV